MQAISLSHERVISARPLLEDGEKLKVDMQAVGQLFITKLHKLPEDISDQQKLFAHQLRAEVTGYNMALRKWAYYFQMLNVGKEIGLLIKDKFNDYYKIDPENLMVLFFDMGTKIEERVNVHMPVALKVL